MTIIKKEKMMVVKFNKTNTTFVRNVKGVHTTTTVGWVVTGKELDATVKAIRQRDEIMSRFYK